MSKAYIANSNQLQDKNTPHYTVPNMPPGGVQIKGRCGTMEDFRRRYSTNEDPTYTYDIGHTKTPKRVVDDGEAGLCLDLSTRR
ncbi:unnamed protein product [Clonostachys solani]|uniref:Uncharacterized protein n=1 Tax=Clonostachys solani TaxID=160281 RepID=A0A9N9W7V2_9HYPO|nr:unnamed protein product [Clonostachys solani]